MAAFAQGLGAAQQAFGCHLIGGDTDHTPGPLSIGVTAIGTVPKGAFVQRRGAKAGDHVFVTGRSAMRPLVLQFVAIQTF